MVAFAVDTGGRVGGRSCLLKAVCCCAGAGEDSGFSFMTSKGSNGSRGGREGRALEKRDRPVLGGSREDDPSMIGEPPFGFRALIYRDCGGMSVHAHPVCRLKRDEARKRDVCVPSMRVRACAGAERIRRTCGRGMANDGYRTGPGKRDLVLLQDPFPYSVRSMGPASIWGRGAKQRATCRGGVETRGGEGVVLGGTGL